MYGFEIITKSQDECPEPVNAVVLILGAYLSACTVWYGFMSVFPIKTKAVIVYVLQFIVIVLWVFISGLKRGGKPAGVLVTAGCALMAVFMRAPLMLGINHFANQYITLKNEFYSTDQPLYEDTHEQGLYLALFLIQMVLAAILVLVLKTGRGALLAAALLALPFILAATVGEMPSTVSGWGIIGAGVIFFIIYRSRDVKKLKREITAAALAFAVTALVAAIVQPAILKVRDKNEKQYIKIHNMLVDIQQETKENSFSTILGGNENYAEGGVGRGDLRNLEENRPKGTTDMVVTVDRYPGETVYLKAFVGSVYTGKKWEEPSEKDLKKSLKDAGAPVDEKALFGEPFERIKGGQNNLESLNMKVKLESASEAFAYSPYYVRIDKKDSVYADAYIRGRREKSREYDFYKMADVQRISIGELEQKSKVWDAYCIYVNQTYKKFPDGLKKIEDYCFGMNSSEADEIAKEIDRRFQGQLTYSMKPGKYPADQDFAEYFLTESKRGFCVHFATAAVLIYRERGCASRYVEGYAVPADAFEQQEDGTWMAVVTDEMAHAWCETFDKELGWRVREHTYSGGENSENLAAPDTTQEEPKDQPENEIRQEEAKTEEEEQTQGTLNDIDDKKDTGGQERAGKKENSDVTKKWMNTIKSVGTMILIAAGGLAVLIFLLVVCQTVRRQRRKYGFRLKSQNRGISNIYRAVCDVAVFAGVMYNENDEHKTLEQMKEMFPQLEDEEWEWMYECAQKAAFAKGQTSRQDQKKMYRLYMKFRESILKELGKGRKLIFLYWKGL